MIEARKADCQDARPVDTIMAVSRFVKPECGLRSRWMRLLRPEADANLAAYSLT